MLPMNHNLRLPENTRRILDVKPGHYVRAIKEIRDATCLGLTDIVPQINGGHKICPPEHINENTMRNLMATLWALGLRAEWECPRLTPEVPAAASASAFRNDDLIKVALQMLVGVCENKVMASEIVRLALEEMEKPVFLEE
jgi:hypothetical protein